MSSATRQIAIRDRVIELRRVKRGEVLPNARNWRRHPEGQRAALTGLLSTIGIAGAALAYYSARNDNQLTYIDGHLRDEEIGDGLPVLITDLNDEEADLLLASYDPVAALAQADREQLDSLLKDVRAEDEALAEMLKGLARENRLYEWSKDDPTEHWRDMPEFHQEHKLGIKTLFVHFNSEADMQEFSELVGQTITMKTKYIWYPKQEEFPASQYKYSDES